MANKAFWIPFSPQNPNPNPFISNDFEHFIGEQWYPYHESVVSNATVFPLSTHFPVKANGREIQYIKTQSYFDDYYNRIHISPNKLELGNIASEQSSTVNVWNAYLINQTLQRIDDIEEGLNLSGQPNPPFTFTGLEERTWNISILTDGPSNIDAKISWNFGLDQAVIQITGTRIVAFSWLVDWNEPITETLQWLTDILQSKTGYEQRRSLRLAPRISFDASFLLCTQERQYFELAMIGWSAKIFALPLWTQQQWLKTIHHAGSLVVYADTKQRLFKNNRLAILRGNTAFENETIEIDQVLDDRLILKRPLQHTWQIGSCLSPAFTARLQTQPNLTKRTDQVMRTRLSFILAEPVNHVAKMPTLEYRNYPVLDSAPNEKNDLTHSYERLLSQLDNSTGLMLQKDQAQAAFCLYQYNWLSQNKYDQAELRALFYALRGRQKALWLPSFSDDLSIKSDLQNGMQTFDIAWCGYSRFASKQLGRQDIQILLKDQAPLYLRIISAAEVDQYTERLMVDQFFKQTIQRTQIIRVSFMSLCRLANDHVVIEHLNDCEGVAHASVTFRGVREI